MTARAGTFIGINSHEHGLVFVNTTVPDSCHVSKGSRNYHSCDHRHVDVNGLSYAMRNQFVKIIYTQYLLQVQKERGLGSSLEITWSLGNCGSHCKVKKSE